MTDTPNLPVPQEPLTQFKLAALAREIAMNIRELPDILQTFHLTEDEFAARVETNEFFKRVFEAAVIEWNGVASTHERIKAGAAAALEDALPGLAARMSVEGETLTGVVEVGKLLSKLAQIGEGPAAGNPGDKFSITINLGEDKKLTFEKDVTPAIPLITEKTHEPS